MAKKFDNFNGGVTFGGVSIGETTARLGIAIDRGVINLNRADDLFVDRRLTGKVILGTFDEDSGQKKLIDDVNHQVAGSFDVKGFRCSSEHIATGLTFSLKEIDIAELAKFSKGQGRLVINGAEPIPEEAKEPPIKGHKPGSLKRPGKADRVNLDELFEPESPIRKGMAEKGLNTVGALGKFTEKGGKLTDIPGVGPKKVEFITDTLEQFWKENAVFDFEEVPEEEDAAV